MRYEFIRDGITDTRCEFRAETTIHGCFNLSQSLVIKTYDRDILKACLDALADVSDLVIDRCGYRDLARYGLVSPFEKQIYAALAIQNFFFNSASETKLFGNFLQSMLNRPVLCAASPQIGRRRRLLWSGNLVAGRLHGRGRLLALSFNGFGTSVECRDSESFREGGTGGAKESWAGHGGASDDSGDTACAAWCDFFIRID